MPKSRLSAFLSLLLVFLSGAVVGGFAHRLYMVKTVISGEPMPPPRGRSPEEVLKQRLEDMKVRVKADDQQLDQIKTIYGETRQQFDQMHERMNREGHSIEEDQVSKIKAILRPEQITLYDQVRAEYEAARKRRQQLREQNEKKKQ